jgi:hypothetical protein
VVTGLPQEMRPNKTRAFPGKVVTGLPQEMRPNKTRAFPGKVVTGLPQEMRPNKKSRARFQIDPSGTRSCEKFAPPPNQLGLVTL